MAVQKSKELQRLEAISRLLYRPIPEMESRVRYFGVNSACASVAVILCMLQTRYTAWMFLPAILFFLTSFRYLAHRGLLLECIKLRQFYLRRVNRRIWTKELPKECKRHLAEKYH